jgi:hypothetical protein
MSAMNDWLSKAMAAEERANQLEGETSGLRERIERLEAQNRRLLQEAEQARADAWQPVKDVDEHS